jgi:pSer/pThr/pTyr-binding forkhead associated (FHA) protein
VLEVSRHHVELHSSEKSIHFKDLGSANGTYLNNKRVGKGKLSPGDHLIVGPVVFTVQIDGEPAEIRAVRTRLRSRAAAAKEAEEGAITDEDPISALEALASSADQTALDPFEEDEEEEV